MPQNPNGEGQTSGDSSPRKVSRRTLIALGIAASGALGAAAALDALVKLGHGADTTPAPQPTGDPNSFNQGQGAALQATKEAANKGEIIGDAVGNFPPEVIERARRATGIITVHLRDGQGERGTASIVNVNGQIALLSAAHVLTGGGQYTPDQIESISFVRPHIDKDYTELPASAFRVATPANYHATTDAQDLRHDAGVAVLHDGVLAGLLGADALSLAPTGVAGNQGKVMVAGFPRAIEPDSFDPTFLADMPLLAGVGVATRGGDSQPWAVEGPVISGGSSGSPILTHDGKVLAVADASDPTYRDMHYVGAGAIDEIPQLVAQAS